MLKQRRRGRERGQALIMVLVFTALFSLVAYSLVGLARAVGTQHATAERTSAMDASSEGSAQFSMADVGSQQCTPAVGAGSMTFPATPDGLFGSQTLNYTLGPGDCTRSTTGGNAPGATCLLCVLNTSSPNPATPVINTNDKTLTVNGEIDANGSVTGHGLTATGPNAKIGLYDYGSGSTCGTCSPPPTNLTSPFIDPLRGRVPIPPSSSVQSCCASVIGPGVYSGMGVTSSVFLKSGVYIDTGAISVSGSGNLSNSDADLGGVNDSDSSGLSDSDSGGLNSSDSGGLTDSGSGATVTYTQGSNKTATTLVDTSKNWASNQWVGALVRVAVSGGSETDVVQSNTKTTLTLNAVWAPTVPVAGTQYRLNTLYYRANTLVDTQMNWPINRWAGAVVTVTLSGSTTESGVVASNTATTLTLNANWSSVPAPGAPYEVSQLGYTSNTLVDTTKNWTANVWTGALVTVTLAGSTTEIATVASNTSNTLTMAANWSSVPGPGAAYRINTLYYTSNSLVDTQRNWTINQWAGAEVTVTHNGAQQTDIVSSNTSHTLTMSRNWSPMPAAGDAYQITVVYYPTSNTLVDSTRNWTPNQWQGAVVTVTLIGGGTETATVQSNTSNTMTMTSNWGTIPASGSGYGAATQVVIYLACQTTAPFWGCAQAGQAGGTVIVSGLGTINLVASQSGPYAGILVFSDPNLIDPIGGYVLNVSGNGGSLGGTVYVPRGTLAITGGGSSGRGWSVSGRVVVQDLFIAGNPNARLSLSANGASLFPACFYYDESLHGQAATLNLGGQLLFETGCASAGKTPQGPSPTTIVSFSYLPFP